MEIPAFVPSQYIPYTLAGALALLIILAALIIWRVSGLEKRLSSILGGGKAGDIEQSLKGIHTEIQELREFKKEHAHQLATLEKKVARSVQSVETLRFNAFKGNGGGGNQSFATGFIDERGNGVVISGLYSRERMSVYAKPVKTYSSDHSLSDEEKEVLSRAAETVQAER